MSLINLTPQDDFFSGVGNDTLHGLGGNDVILGLAGAGVIFGDAGNDTLYDNDQSGSDTDHDSLYGGTGLDTLTLGIGDLGDGGVGYDRANLYLQNAGAAISFAMQADAFVKVGGTNAIELRNIEAITLWGSTFGDTITTGDGRDIIAGNGGFDHIHTGAGNDSISLSSLSFEVDGGSGFDRLTFDLDGMATTDFTLTMGPTLNLVVAGGGGVAVGIEALTISVGAGNQNITGGAYSDDITVYFGNDTVQGGGGNDAIFGSYGTEHLYGGFGNDHIHYYDDATSFVPNLTVIDGGGGNDTLSAYVHTAKGVSIFGGYGDDLINADLTGGALHGGWGDDTIRAVTIGFDNVWGDGGNDSISVLLDALAATTDGGAGRDTLVGSLSSAGDHMTAGLTANGYAGTTDSFHTFLATGFEVFQITGGTNGDSISGGGLGDILSGGAFATAYPSDSDTLLGLGGNDTLNGMSGGDFLFGGFGNDRIDGGAGFDHMTGGAGADIFVFHSIGDSSLGQFRDVIVDFQPGADRLDLSAIGAHLWIGSAGFHHVAGEVQAIASTGFVLLALDANGDGTADFEISLTGTPVLTASDITLA